MPGGYEAAASVIKQMATSASSGGVANLSSISGWAPSAGGVAVHAHKKIVSGKAIEELFVVLSVMAVLGIVASVVGRMCGGRHLGGDSPFDFEGWVEKQCAVCIDGEVEDPPAPDAPAPPEGDIAVPPQPEAPPELPPPPPDDPPPPPPDPPPPPPAPPAPPEGSASMVVPYHHYYYHYSMPYHNNCRCHYCCNHHQLVHPYG